MDYICYEYDIKGNELSTFPYKLQKQGKIWSSFRCETRSSIELMNSEIHSVKPFVGSNSGYWIITDKGREFAISQIRKQMEKDIDELQFAIENIGKTSSKVRQIELSEKDLNCYDGLLYDAWNELEEPCIEATYELWLDVDKYFGTNTKDSSSWINFYTYWHPEKPLEAIYIIDGDNFSEEHKWELTPKEQEMLTQKMQDYCQKINGMSLEEFWQERLDFHQKAER